MANTTTNKVQVENSTTTTGTSTTYKVSSPPMEYGWACPRCGRINAPWKSTCDCAGGYYYTTWEYREPWWKQVYCNGTSAQSQIDSNTFKIHPESTTYYNVGGSDYYNPNTHTYENTSTNPSNNPQFTTKTIHVGKTNYKE